jgi:hypothetical protein
MRNHAVLEAGPLALIAIAYLLYQLLHRSPAPDLAKAILLAVAFLAWAANQIWPDPSQAILFNDLAISLFVFDLFLVIAGWPPASTDQVFAASGEGHEQGHDCRNPLVRCAKNRREGS